MLLGILEEQVAGAWYPDGIFGGICSDLVGVGPCPDCEIWSLPCSVNGETCS